MQNSYRLLRLVNNLLEMTKIDDGYCKLRPIQCNIVNLIEEIVDSVANYLGENKRTIIFDTDYEEILTSCDPDKIETIVLNLLSNAIKFTNTNGIITINISKTDDLKNVFISIKDNGTKIDKKYSKIIFNKFTQIDDLLTRPCEGSGLGLALTKSLVKLHGGNIWLNSEFKDGSEFIFTIPIKNYSSAAADKMNLKLLNCNIEKYNVEFSDIYNLSD